MLFNKKIRYFLAIGVLSISSCAISLFTTSCNNDDSINKFVYGSTFEINVDNAKKVEQHAKTFLNKSTKPIEFKSSDFNTWKSEHLLINGNYYWELVIYQALRIKNAKSGNFIINKWDVNTNNPANSKLSNINLVIDNQTYENISGELTYSSNTNKITCAFVQNTHSIQPFVSWQWDMITIIK